MAVSYKDWEVPYSWITLAKIDNDNSLNFPDIDKNMDFFVNKY